MTRPSPLTVTPLVLFLVGACHAFATDASEAARIAELLHLTPGQVVADVGAGDGDWVEGLLAAVSPGGAVWATEVVEDRVEGLRSRWDEASVRVVLGDASSSGLPAGCCDAILLRLVYHHFVEPKPMLDDLRAALHPGGRLLVIETRLKEHWDEVADVPDRGGHGISVDDLLREMTTHGWKPLEQELEWNVAEEHFAIVFVPNGNP